MKMTITNNSQAIQGIAAAEGGLHYLKAGETRELDVLDSYAERVGELSFLSVKGKTPKPAPVAVPDGAHGEDRSTASEAHAGHADGARSMLAQAQETAQNLAQPPSDLARAVAALDDANDDHWIQSGKPSLDHLSEVMGDKVTRADVDALDPPRIRVLAD